MVEALIIFTLAACSLGVLASLRLWTHKRSGHSISTLVLIFCFWIVSTVVWNTYYLSFPMPGLFDISIDRALFILIITLSTLKVLFKRVRLKANYSIELSIFIFSIICLASMSIFGFNAHHPDYPKPFYIFLFGYFAPFCAFMFAKYFITNEANFRLFLTTLFLLGVYLCIIAILERNGLKEYIYPRYITYTTFTMHLDRARGPFLNAAFNGVGMTLGFISGILLLRNSNLGKRVGIYILLSLYIPGIFYTHTRSIYLIFLYSLITLLIFYQTRASKWKIVPMVFFICIALVAANSKHIFSESRTGGGIAQMEEVAIRFQLIERSGRLFSANPLFGVGLAKFSAIDSSPEFFHEQQHNHILGMAVELGLVGTFSYLIIIMLIFFRLYSLASNPTINTKPSANTITLLTLAITINLINNIFVEPSYCPFINISTFTFAGIIDRLHESPNLISDIQNAKHSILV